MGEKDFFTAYDGKLTSFLLALGLARAAPPETRFIWILNNIQTSIKEPTDPPPPKSCQHIRHLIGRELQHLLTNCPTATIVVIWCAKGGDNSPRSQVDTLAKAATLLRTSSGLLTSYKALQVMFKEQEKGRIDQAEVDPTTLHRIHNSFQPAETYKALSKLAWPDTTMVAHLRSGHCPLNAYLFRFRVADSPHCALGGNKETIEHFLLTCRKFVGLHRRLFKAASKVKIPHTRQALLSDPRMFQSLADFGQK